MISNLLFINKHPVSSSSPHGIELLIKHQYKSSHKKTDMFEKFSILKRFTYIEIDFF